MKAVIYILALVLALAGIGAILAASQANFIPRMLAGVICIAAAAALALMARFQPVQHTHVHEMKLDVSGDVSLQQIQCKQCGGELSSKSVKMAEGAIFVTCEYCGAQYQMEEEAKW